MDGLLHTDMFYLRKESLMQVITGPADYVQTRDFVLSDIFRENSRKVITATRYLP